MIPFPMPVLPIIGPLIAAVVLLLLGRWSRVQALVGAGAAVILAAWVVILPVGNADSSQGAGLFRGSTWTIAGRPLVINEGLQDLIVFFLLAGGLLFLLSSLFWQGRTFAPAGLAAVSPLAAALMAPLLAFGAILLIIAVTLLVMSYSPVVREKTQGSLRYLLLFVLALVPLLLAGWLFESGQVALNSPLIVTMLAAAFAILLAGFPFYIWVYPIVAEAPFLVPALIFGVAQTGTVAFLLPLLLSNPWLQENAQFQDWLTWSGIGTVLVAALLILTAGKWRFLWGHLLLLNMGMSVLAFTLPLQSAADIAILFHLSRFVSLLLAGTALSLLQQQGQSEIMADSQGWGRRAPLTVALLMLSFFSLLGVPLTIGFPAQWSLITAFGQQSSLLLSAFLVLAMTVAAYRVLRILATLVGEDDEAPGNREANWQKALAAIMLICVLLLALYSQPLLNYAKELSAAFID